MIYETMVTEIQPSPVLLSVPGVRDRATVFVDHVPFGVLSRFIFNSTVCPINGVLDVEIC